MDKKSFHIRVWSTLSTDEKLAALQQLEQNLAKEQGRKPVKIKDPRAMDQEELRNLEDSEGYYDHSKQFIYIRLNSLNQKRVI